MLGSAFHFMGNDTAQWRGDILPHSCRACSRCLDKILWHNSCHQHHFSLVKTSRFRHLNINCFLTCESISETTDNWRNYNGNTFKFVVTPVPADALAPSGARASAGTVMINSGRSIYTTLAFEVHISIQVYKCWQLFRHWGRSRHGAGPLTHPMMTRQSRRRPFRLSTDALSVKCSSAGDLSVIESHHLTWN